MRTTLGASLISAALLLAAAGTAAQEVTLPLSRYDDLRARAGMAPEHAPTPPAPFALESADFDVRAGAASARVVQRLALTLFSPDWQKVPLGAAGSFIAADLGGLEGRVAADGDAWTLQVRGSGRHEVRLESVVPLARDETATRPVWHLRLRAPAAAVVRGRIAAPEAVEEVDLGISGLARRGADGAWAFVARPAQPLDVTLAGRRTLPVKARLPLRFEATSATAATLTRTRFAVRSWIEARVAQGRLPELRVPLPQGPEEALEVVSVDGPVAGWTVEGGDLVITPLEESGPGEVKLPLTDYLALVGRVEAAEKAKAQRKARREAPVAEVTAQRVSLTAGEDEAEVNSELEVLVQGSPDQPVFLPLPGISERVEVTPATASVTAVTAGKEVGGGALLVAPVPGRYVVRVHGRLPVARDGGVGRLALAPVVAPVAEIQADLPAGLGWSSPGTVVVEEREESGRRKVRLAAERGKATVLELRRQVDGSDADRLLARAVVLTLFQLRPDGARRHDVLFYEVSRGGLGSFTVDLPPGLDVEQVGTDEGSVVPVTEATRLTVQRQKQLQGTGYLVLTSTPAASPLALSGVTPAAGDVPFAFVRPGIEVRARYLALATSVAAEVRPVPEKSWARVDLDDLPAALREALGALDLSAAWRLLAAPPGLALAVRELPKAPALEEVVRLRETTTLVTVDGTVLHRDRFTVEGGGEAFDLALPEGATFWSARVGDQPVRPVDRNGRVSVPLGFERGPVVVEVVSVLQNKIPAGRSRLGLELPRVDVPVLDHRWRLLLPALILAGILPPGQVTAELEVKARR